MRRRDVLKASAASLAALAAPQIGQGERANKLVFVPTEDLSVLDRTSRALARDALTLISSSTRSMASIRIGWRSRKWPKGTKSMRRGLPGP